MPDEARDGRNVAFELSSDLLVCSIVQRNHSTINTRGLIEHVYSGTYAQEGDLSMDRCMELTAANSL